jgi:T4 RnlA family RNA ligase
MYNDLMNLCNESDAFFFKDFEKDGCIYRIFNYRLTTYTEFLKPNALNCRGTMYDLTDENNPSLVCLPPSKFFNLNENPFTENLDLSGNLLVMDKEDGSLISTYRHNSRIYLKTKGSLTSEQSQDAMRYLNDHHELYNFLDNIHLDGFTVNMEWTAPQNRVVVPHQTEKLTILNARHMKTSEYMNHFELKELMERWGLEEHMVDARLENKAFVDSIKGMNSWESDPIIEGFVVVSSDGVWFKVKTERYLLLHRSKDDVTNLNALFGLIINEQTDDLKSLFHNDQYLMDRINLVESELIPKYDNMIAIVENFYQENNQLERKEYAIKGQAELGGYFGLGMSLYLGREPQYKEFALKNKELFLSELVDM